MKRAAVMLGVCLFLLTGISLHTKAKAAEPGALQLTASPLPISLKVEPGESVKTELRIRNSGTQNETLKVGLMKFAAYGEEGKPALQEREPGDHYFDWVRFSENRFTAIPGEWHSLTMTIDVPPSAALGYYYAVTFSRANPEAASGPREQTVQGGISTLVLLEANSPNAKKEVKLVDFKAGKRMYEFLPANFTVRLHNTGNIHTAPSGTIFIRRGEKQIATLGVNTTKGNILPGSSRNFTTAWEDGFPAYKLKEANGGVVLKDGKPVYSLKWDPSKLTHLRFGKYTADVVMAYDNGKQDVPLEATLSFWVMPWRILLVLLLIILLVMAGLWSTGRKVAGRFKRRR